MDLTKDIESKHFDAQGTLAKMDNYYRWILGTFGDNVGDRVWDAGAGIGNVSELLLERASFVLATEFTEKNIEALRTRFEKRSEVEVAHCDLTKPEALDLAQHKLDTIVTLDVLEHLEDDRAALQRYHEILQPGGAFLIKVPAHMFLFGTMDEASLHYRRYGKRELRQKMEQAGFRVERIRHMNMVATLPYLLKGRILKRKRNFSGTINGGKLGLYNSLMPWFERVEKVIPPLFGLSLIAVGRKAN
ncbi:MAG: 2-polyprenyl-3-methyl-5-hydroxy-6-metoxy-1,4-benzoquinol methylase [Planctomycetota bacterium]|jgi:2-polyprenyl-3-methyl-5-hydroxy-6-metoxy-1,4-benzoquinol methylase